MLESSILMSEKHQALFAKMSKEQKMSIFRAIRIECGRSEVEHHLHNDGSRRLVCIQKQVPIADLTESQVVDSINKMHFAADVLMDTMDTLMPPDKVLAGIANSEGDTTPKAAIELLDDLLVEGAVIEKFCGDMCDGEIAKSKVEPWIAKVRSALRNNAPDYVAAFNDTVSRGTTGRLHPHRKRTIIEMGKWAEDRERQKAWQLAFACLVKLTEIRRAMRAKLPL